MSAQRARAQVARKIGGIYTVLKSKSPVTVADWGDRFVFDLACHGICVFVVLGCRQAWHAEQWQLGQSLLTSCPSSCLKLLPDRAV